MALKPIGKQLKVLGQPEPETPWVSAGIVQGRPSICKLCRYQYKSVGFTSTWVGADPKIAVVFPHPDKEEVVNRIALDSERGRRFLYENIFPIGLTKDNLIISYVIRCLPPWDAVRRQREYPTGSMRTNAEAVCRRYDRLKAKDGDLVTGGIVEWAPDLFIFSMDPADCIKTPSYTRIILRCFEKAASFAAQGRRPVVLLGPEAVKMQAPWVETHGGLKTWAGGYIEQPWKSAIANDRSFRAQ